MESAVILMGTNLNDRKDNLRVALKKMIERIGEAQLESSLYQTAPWGNIQQDDFLNKVVVIRTHLSPQSLLSELLAIEHEMGRIRTSKWAPRLIDLDILYFGEQTIYETGLQIPHPFLQDRRFTLIPLVEILPDFMHPVLKKTNTELLGQTTDNSEVFLLEKEG